MNVSTDLTKGSLARGMRSFSVPYLVACFLQTFYGLADLFIAGRFYGAEVITAVSVGSQLMHMLTVVIVGFAMGATVALSRRAGARDGEGAACAVGNACLLFAVFAALLTAVLLRLTEPILRALETPREAFAEARAYVLICFAGIPFITAYNLLASLMRGLGDTKRPMVFVAISGVFNIALDLLLIGGMRMGASGAAIATVTSQATSVLMALLSLRRRGLGVRLARRHFSPRARMLRELVLVGAPIALQDGFIQISFLVITRIANSRGVEIAAAVGVVEKTISFFFLVPSAMLSTVSAAAAQNAGAGQNERSRAALRLGLAVSCGYGALVFLLCQPFAPAIVGLFSPEGEDVVRLGAQYLRTYSLDCLFAGIHFCMSGFFSAYQKSGYSFLHNVISILAVRIPGALLASSLFPDTLTPMGLAAPLGSLLSALICLYLYRRHEDAWT